MKQTIFSNWTFIRIFRLGIGFAIFIQAIIAKDILFGLIGILFTGMAIFNQGCCSTAGCITATKKSIEPAKDITYEEVV